jgi:hypothetical protein
MTSPCSWCTTFVEFDECLFNPSGENFDSSIRPQASGTATEIKGSNTRESGHTLLVCWCSEFQLDVLRFLSLAGVFHHWKSWQVTYIASAWANLENKHTQI